MDIAVQRDFLVGIAPFVVGLVVVALLIAAVVLGLRRWARTPPLPRDPQLRSGAWQTPDEYRAPAPPAGDHGPGHQDRIPHRSEPLHVREPDEVPRDGRRRLPHEFPGFGNMPSHEGGTKRRTWSPESREN